MNRRSFLRLLGFGTVAAAAASTDLVDLERLLWVPGEKMIFLPTIETAEIWDELSTPEWVTREVLDILEHQLAFASGLYEREWAKAGDTLVVRIPQRWTATAHRIGPDRKTLETVSLVRT